MLIGILSTTVIGLVTGVAKWAPQAYSLSDLGATAGKLDIAGALKIGLVEIVFVFLFIDLFDNIGTLVAVGKKAKLFDESRQIPRLNRILFSDATATIVGSLTGTSTVVSYIESAAGVAAGGRTGVTAIVTGALFVIALFIAPVVGAIPAAATAPALIVVGSMMASVMGEIAWHDPEVAVPAFLTMMTIPLSFSIANGLAFGFTAYSLIKILRGRFREVNWFVYLLTALFLLRFFYLSHG
jgi:AGZA family xanthine/uracil permease-like MFS transporter